MKDDLADIQIHIARLGQTCAAKGTTMPDKSIEKLQSALYREVKP